MRVRPAILAALLALAACASVPKLTPEPRQMADRDDVILQGNGVGLHVIPNGWKGPPGNLTDHFTPIWVHLVNRGNNAYDITYASIQLIDEQGRTYAPVSPMEVVRATVGSVEPVDTAVRLASAGDGDVPLFAQFGFGFGPAYDPFDPFSPYSPYGPYGGYPSYADAARNISVNGLREGRLLPKTQAMGFLYFQRAYDAKQLKLHLEAPSETAGVAPLVLEATFNVAR